MRPEGGADLQQSIELLSKAGLRLYTRQEALPTLMADGPLLNELKGDSFYLSGAGLGGTEDDMCTVDGTGELVGIGSAYVPYDRRVQPWPGDKPLFLDVVTDDLLAAFGARFNLNAQEEPYLKYPVVLGTPIALENGEPELATGSLLDGTREHGERLGEGNTPNSELMRRVIDI